MKLESASAAAPRVSGSSRAGRRQATPLAVLSFVVGLLLIVGQLSTVLHLALVPHHFCALHGLEDGHAAVAAQPLQRGARVADGKQPAARAAGAADCAHDACVFATLTHERLACLRAGVTGLVPAPDTAHVAAIVAGASPHRGRACLDSAPKIGPPA